MQWCALVGVAMLEDQQVRILVLSPSISYQRSVLIQQSEWEDNQWKLIENKTALYQFSIDSTHSCWQGLRPVTLRRWHTGQASPSWAAVTGTSRTRWWHCGSDLVALLPVDTEIKHWWEWNKFLCSQVQESTGSWIPGRLQLSQNLLDNRLGCSRREFLTAGECQGEYSKCSAQSPPQK